MLPPQSLAHVNDGSNPRVVVGGTRVVAMLEEAVDVGFLVVDGTLGVVTETVDVVVSGSGVVVVVVVVVVSDPHNPHASGQYT